VIDPRRRPPSKGRSRQSIPVAKMEDGGGSSLGKRSARTWRSSIILPDVGIVF
jgi:hypothetical protein